MLAKTFGGAVYGVNAHLITIEISTAQGIKMYMVGLPDSAVKESIQRVETAIKHIEYVMPRQRLVVNLAPADLRKEGSSYDLPIALGILKSSEQIIADQFSDYVIMGELGLDGTVRRIKGVLPIAIEAKRRGLKGFILPKDNAEEASVVKGLDIIPVDNLKEAIAYLDQKIVITPVTRDTREIFHEEVDHFAIDFADVQGQETMKRGLEVAAAGGHNLLMIGPPGAGKTMLAKRLPGILPPMTLHEALETTKIHSVAGKLKRSQGLIAHRPFRSPHHSISETALVGGGSIPQPGEISLAHNGVLFLDELPEFRRTALEVMRQPLEDRVVNIARAKMAVDFPANFMLLASMNPCPCGYFNHPDRECVCNSTQIQNYINKISGPLLDRIDLHVEVTPVTFDQMTTEKRSEKSMDIRARTLKARKVQLDRFSKHTGVHCNALMPSHLIKNYCELNGACKILLKTAMERLGLSARAYDRILKVSRTIADLDGSEKILPQHIAEAIQFRNLDRELWKN